VAENPLADHGDIFAVIDMKVPEIELFVNPGDVRLGGKPLGIEVEKNVLARWNTKRECRAVRW
jgi:hypothetical protein